MNITLGCGALAIPGWTNFDIQKNLNVTKHDLRRPLPLEPHSIDFAFSEHFLEHLDRIEGLRLISEVHRVLKPGGVFRLCVPDLHKSVNDYLDWKLNGRDSIDIPVVWEPKTPCQMLNESLREWGHKYMYDADELHAAFEYVGFSSIVGLPYRKSNHAELCNREMRPLHGEIIFEATK